MIYLGASFWLLRLATRMIDDRLWVWEPIIGGFVILFIAPILLGPAADVPVDKTGAAPAANVETRE